MSNPADLASVANHAGADPSSWQRVSDSLKPGAVVVLAAGRYRHIALAVPGVTLHAVDRGAVLVENEVSLEADGAAIDGLCIDGPILFRADGTGAHRATSKGIVFDGSNQVADHVDVSGFQSVGISASGNARNPVVHLCHVHGQVPGGAKGTRAMMMIGHDHADSDKPVNIKIRSTLVEGSLSHDGIEIKSSGAEIDDVTVIGCDLMQRHGIVAMVCRSCWVEGGDIQLNSNDPTAIRCKTVNGIVRVVNGTSSVEELLHKKKGGKSLYPYANNARVYSHDGTVVVGWNAKRPLWKLPALGTKVADCASVQNPHNVECGQAEPLGQLPPAPRKLTPADIGPPGAPAR